MKVGVKANEQGSSTRCISTLTHARTRTPAHDRAVTHAHVGKRLHARTHT